MKRLVRSLMLACLIVPVVVALSACGGDSKTKGFTEGIYKGTGIEIKGQVFKSSDFEKKLYCYEHGFDIDECVDECEEYEYQIEVEVLKSGSAAKATAAWNALSADEKLEFGDDPKNGGWIGEDEEDEYEFDDAAAFEVFKQALGSYMYYVQMSLKFEAGKFYINMDFDTGAVLTTFVQAGTYTVSGDTVTCVYTPEDEEDEPTTTVIKFVKGKASVKLGSDIALLVVEKQ